MEHLNEEVDVLDNDSDIDIEIEDDTPEEDRGREPLANAEEVSDDELSQYSTKVQKRINEVNRKYHDERRAKEAIARQSAEAVNYAKAVLEENNRLKETLTWGEKALIEQAQQKLVYDTVIAEAQYKRAYEDNDSEALVMAQRELYRVQTEADQIKKLSPRTTKLAFTPSSCLY